MKNILKFGTILLFITLCLTTSCSDDPVTGEFNSYDVIPTDLLASNGIYDSTIYITWKSVTNASGYNLKRRDDPKIGDFDLIAENISDTFFIDDNVIIGTKYYYKVNAIFGSVSDTSTYSDLEEGYAGILDTSANDTSSSDTTTDPKFILLTASEGSSDSSIVLNWTNCGAGYKYSLSSSSFEDSTYTTLSSSLTDTFYIHKNIVPGPYSYRITAINNDSSDTLKTTAVGYRSISNLEFFLEVNKTYKYSQSKVGKLNNEALGVETVGGDYHGTLEYNSYLEGLSSAKAILTYDNYRDFYLTLNGVQTTKIEALFAKDGNVYDIVFVDGIYKGFVDHHIEVDGGDPSGGFYTIGQTGLDTSDIQFSDVKDDVLN